MGNIWDSITSTAESLGGAAVAPAGAAIDLAQMAFDDKDDSFGDVVGVLANSTAASLNPIINPHSGLVGGISKAMAAMNWAYVNGVSEPIGTLNTMTQHVTGASTLAISATGPLGLAGGFMFGDHHYADIFDAASWSEAYKQANQQTNAAGATLAWGALNPRTDPLSVENPYETVTKEHGSLASGIAWSGEIAGMFGADPSVAALKGVGAGRAVLQYGKLNQAEKNGVYSLITEGSRAGKLRLNLQSRSDNYFGWIGGQNKVGRPLSQQEIYHGTPELQRYAKDPQAVAGFLADANRITDPVERVNVQRRIVAIAGGDYSQVARLRAENTEAAGIADQISNMAREGVMDLDALAVAPTLAQNPIFRLRLENQLTNLNKTGDVDRFIENFTAYNERLIETFKSAPNLPGVHGQGIRTVNRMNDMGLARKPAQVLDNWAASYAQKAQSASTVFQKGKYGVPLVAVKTVGLAASPWTKAPVAVSDALRTPAFTGMVSIHDWGSGLAQLDRMMDIAKVDPALKRSLIDEASLALDEGAKNVIANRVEHAAVQGIARWASERAGVEIHPDYVSTVLEKGARARSATQASLKGRVYAATEGADLSRAGSAGRIEDATALGQSRGATAETQGKWRLDQINDDGTPLALPVFETQLDNYIPLLDVDLVRRQLGRETGHFARLSKAWHEESKAYESLLNLKAKGATGIDKLIEGRAWARDFLVDAGQRLLHAWKFSVLFRLGYPMRVLMDDHFRIWSKIGAGSFYGPNLKEFGGNAKTNLGRRAASKAAMRDLKTQKQQILDHLSSNEMMVHESRRGDLALLEKKIGSHQGALASLRRNVQAEETKQSLGLPNSLADAQKKLSAKEGDLAEHEAQRDYLAAQLGDYGPEQLKLQLEEIEARIEAGAKAERAPKLRIGDANVQLGEDSIAGAFGGEYGGIMRAAVEGNLTDHLLQGAEVRGYSAMSGGSHDTFTPLQKGYAGAWADALNHQIATSEVGKFFLNGGTVDDFVKWIKLPEQALLRRRVAHFAHDPEDWGGRAHGIVNAYVPNEGVREALLKGRVTPKQLEDLTLPYERPAVHGRAVADNLGHSSAMQSVSHTLSRMFRALSDTPTNRLSRNPYFNAMYQQHARDFYTTIRMQRPAGHKFTQTDLDEIAGMARKAALRDLKTTLYDLGSHSHAAEVMRFVSPFFAAHQEGVARWWRITGDKPQIIRRFTQVMDVPRYLSIEVDENGDLVKPGSPLSSQHRILLQKPMVYGGDNPEDHYDENGKLVLGVQSNWAFSENAFNVVLQGGLTNPGTGPMVSVPMDYLAREYAQVPAIARVARIFNPFPGTSPIDNIVPATAKRLSAYTYGKTGFDPSLVGIGQREYNNAMGQNMQDAMVDFQLKYGREPTKAETADLREDAATHTNAQMFHRFLWNVGSPAPATPRSKYALIQQGWYKLQEQAKTEGKDFDWAWAQFKAKYGEAYLPLTASPSNNPAWLDANPATVAAIKHYKPVLTKIDPSLTRMVTGAYADEMIEKNATLGEYGVDARNYLRSEAITPGSDETYYSYDDPATAVNEQMARRGWQKYGELTGVLTAQAQALGLKSYQESPDLMALKKAGLISIGRENFAWAQDAKFDPDSGQWLQFGDEEWSAHMDDMRRIASSPVLANDPERTDIKKLQSYLLVRDYFTQLFQQREAAGYGTRAASAQNDLRSAFTQYVASLVADDTYFETYMYNGTIERDPYLMSDAEVAAQ